MALLKKKKEAAAPAPAKVVEAAYDIIVAPVITEKAMKAAESEQVIFKVAKTADKASIKKAVEALFGVKVAAVNTMIGEGKVKRFRQRPGQRSDYKKAVVSLVKGQNIDLNKGIK
ncbi:50S ribosomal protein L23 [Alphaproteobacteria bacterium]|nr:50S ribosomal protein L23 [Alphaproteobacteria bacterium]